MKYFSLISKEEEIHPAEDQKVIPSDEFSTLVDASEILSKAKEDAVHYKEKVKKECQHLKEQAKEEGFEEGLKRFNEEILRFDGELKRLRHEMQKLILPIALKAARKIVGKELELFPETIVDIVLQALTPALQSKRITIYVNKSDRGILDAEKSKIREILDQVESLSIHERADIAPGGCIIETESGIINATVDNQWRALEAAFEKYVKR